MEDILPPSFCLSVLRDVILMFCSVPYHQAWIHQPGLNASMGQETVKAFLYLVDTKAVHTADLTETLLPVRLLKAFQAAFLQIIDDSQINIDGGLPVVKRCSRDVIKQGLGYLNIRHFNDETKIDI